ncbi:TrkH family potassium uptake protein [Primorskyibacter flagellatus]|uniref:Trk system potassium uptake protein TrkH n=1 Tax=Primorskyibacter flagellatus TaxID=1387277 RepID=A0A1W2BP40_9RHOB|nr:potassium transporter TrkG [Primorskyibacter flagellatus]SMC74697.1 trk system potassium uptake protein TrkH [Primorskyibacter flagellatus]
MLLNRLKLLPFLLLLTVLACAAMLVPAAYALAQQSFHEARSFFYTSVVGLVLSGLVATAMSGRTISLSALRQLAALLAGFVLIPALLAVPFFEAVRTTTFLNAYFEMVSSLTTTGATLFEPDRLTRTQHLWRAEVGWLGGLLMWIAAAAILAPLTLGGFEVTAGGEPGQISAAGAARLDMADPTRRLWRSAHYLVPIYAGLTLVLWLSLMVAGDRPLVAVIHAMSVMATSGISSIGGLDNASSGFAGEVVVFFFLAFALSRLTFSSDTINRAQPGLRHDPEFRLGLIFVIGVPLLLFLRHWIASFEFNEEENLMAGLRAYWGATFTVLSFLTTTGFESAEWNEAQNWSGLQTPGLILLGLSLIGGGVATTAGGVKLLRVFALYLNGMREIERLVHPHSVGRASAFTRRVRRSGAFIAWIFFMLFALSFTMVTMALTAVHVPFENAMVLAIATLSTTGPLITSASETPIDLVRLGAEAKIFLCAAMILGRFETLAIIAMITPDLWRE